MILPEILRREYERFVALPETRGIALSARTLAGGDLPELDQVDDETVHSVYLRLSAAQCQRTHDGEMQDSHLDQAQRVIDKERISRGIIGVAPEAATPMLELMGQLTYEISIVRHYLAEKKIDRARNALEDVKRKLPHKNKVTSSRLTLERETLEFEIAHATADLAAAGGEADSATKAFRSALEQAKAVDRLIHQRRYEPGVVLQYAAFLAKENPDRLLEQLLPVAEKELDEKASLGGVNLKRQLAEFYRGVNDHVTAKDMLDQLARDLADLGYEDSASGDYIDALPTWVRVAAASESRYVDRIRAFSNVIVAYVTLYALRFRGPEGREEDGERMEALVRLFHELRRVETETYRANAEFIEEHRDKADSTQSLPPVPEAPDDAQRQAFIAAVTLFNSGDRSLEILSTLSRIGADRSFAAIYRGGCLLKLALSASDEGAIDKANTYLDEAVKLGEVAGRLDLQVEGLHLKAIIAAEQNEWRKAADLAGEAIDRIERARNMINVPYAATSFMSDKYQVYLLGINAARKINDPALMLRRMEYLKAREMTTQMTVLGMALEKVFHKISLLMSMALDQNIPKAERRLAIKKRRLLWDQCQLLRSEPEIAFDLHRLQKLIDDKAIVLSYFFLDDTVLLATAVSRRHVRTFHLPIADGRTFFDALDRIAAASWRSPGLEYDLQDIAGILLPSTLDEFIGSANQLIVCMHQTLHQVPFLALPWKGMPLIEHVPVGVVPNLTCLLSENVRRPSRNDLFAVASRTCRDEDFNLLPELPYVEEEANAIVELWRGVGAKTFIYKNKKATRDVITDPFIRDELRSSRFLYFGVHGGDVAEADVANHPMEAKLYLRDGPVDGLEISALDLNAELVILAACFAGKRAISARGLARLPTDTIYGLQAAFHQAGVQSIIGALWPANDSTTPKIMKALATKLRDGCKPPLALQQALRNFLKTSTPIEKEVGFWACFQFVGFNSAVFGLGK